MAPSRLFGLGMSASNPQKLLAASPLGIYSSTNAGATWSRSDDGLDGVVVRELATGGGRVYSAGDYDEIGIGDASEGFADRRDAPSVTASLGTCWRRADRRNAVSRRSPPTPGATPVIGRSRSPLT